MATAAVASTITPSLLSSTTYVIAPAQASRATASTVFHATTGSWISDELVLPGTPVTGSIIRWSATIPAGTTLTVFTSVNNGASWDLATANKPIPRLIAGNTSVRTVIVKVEYTRPTALSTSPKLTSLEVQVSCNSGVVEMVPVGFGMIDKVTVQTSISGGTSSTGGGAGVTARGGGQTGGGTSVTLHVVDPSRWIKLAQWEQPFTIPALMNYSDALLAMVQDRYPFLEEWSIASTTRTVPSVLIFGQDQGGDPWQDIRELAAAYGFECFFDAAGRFVAQPVPDPRKGVPVYEIDQTLNPVVTDAKREWSDDKIFNYVVGKGESTSSANPITAYRFDDDPSSKTYVGRIGKRVARITFPQITDPNQLQEAVDAVFYNSLGSSDLVTITCVPIPWLEPGDIIRLNLPQPGVNGTYLIQSMTLPLDVGAMTMTCFRQTDREFE